MTLTAFERQRLKELVGRHQLGWLTMGEEQEMRQLIAKEYPNDAKVMDLATLALLGLGILAAWYLLKD